MHRGALAHHSRLVHRCRCKPITGPACLTQTFTHDHTHLACNDGGNRCCHPNVDPPSERRSRQRLGAFHRHEHVELRAAFHSEPELHRAVHTRPLRPPRCQTIREPQVIHFGDAPHGYGYSMVQFIETSHVAAHFAEDSNAVSPRQLQVQVVRRRDGHVLPQLVCAVRARVSTSLRQAESVTAIRR